MTQRPPSSQPRGADQPGQPASSSGQLIPSMSDDRQVPPSSSFGNDSQEPPSIQVTAAGESSPESRSPSMSPAKAPPDPRSLETDRMSDVRPPSTITIHSNAATVHSTRSVAESSSQTPQPSRPVTRSFARQQQSTEHSLAYMGSGMFLGLEPTSPPQGRGTKRPRHDDMLSELTQMGGSGGTGSAAAAKAIAAVTAVGVDSAISGPSTVAAHLQQQQQQQQQQGRDQQPSEAIWSLSQGGRGSKKQRRSLPIRPPGTQQRRQSTDLDDESSYVDDDTEEPMVSSPITSPMQSKPDDQRSCP